MKIGMVGQLKICPVCKLQANANADRCLQCGHVYNEARNRTSPWLIVAISLALTACAILYTGLIHPEFFRYLRDANPLGGR